MITPDLIAYISEQLGLGKTKDQIKLSLIEGGGWRSSDVDEAFGSLEHPETHKVPRRKHSSALTFFAVLILIVGAVYFVAQRFNIHSYQDAVNVIKGTPQQ